MLRLTGRTLHLWRIDSNSTPTDMLQIFSNTERFIAGGQCDHVYLPAQAESDFRAAIFFTIIWKRASCRRLSAQWRREKCNTRKSGKPRSV